MVFEFAGVADEAPGGEEGLDEVDDAIGATVLPLAVGEDPVEAPPFCGLAGVIIEAPVVKSAGDLIARAAFSQQPCEQLDMGFWECGDGIHGF